MRDRPQSPAVTYACSIAFAVVALLCRALLDPWLGDSLPFVTLFGAVAAAVWLGGHWPGLLTAVIGYVACDYFFIEPRGTLGSVRFDHIVGLVAYLISCAIIVGFGVALRAARGQARAQHDLLQITLGSIGDAVITTDLEGRVVDLNRVAESLTGWSREAASGQPLDAVFRTVHETTRERVESPVARVLRGDVEVGLASHTVLISKDGTERPIDDRAAPIQDADGNVAGCVLVFRDVTERRAAELALRRNERELSDFFENASVGLHSVGPDGTVLRVNSAELELLGYTREECVGRHISEFHADREAVEDILACLKRGETLRDQPARLRCKDGSVRDVLISANVLFEDGKFIHTRCFTRDVTAQRRAEAALRESQQAESALRVELETLIRAAPAAIWVAHDPSCEVVTRNRAASGMLRIPEGEPFPTIGAEIPGHVAIFRSGEHTELDELPMRTAARTGQPVHDQVLELRFRDGASTWAYGNAVPLLDSEGKVRGAISAFVDVTELKRAEAALQENDHRKDVFLATLAHELRNPLAPLRNSLEIVRHDGTDSQRVHAALETMSRQISHMERLIDDLLDVSRITHDRLELRLQRVELASVLEHALEASRPLAESRRHDLVVQLPDEPVQLNGDPVRLAQIFGNLLNNAFKYTHAGGRITVRAERSGDGIVVSVADNGVGIAPELLPHIFEMFARADGELERSAGGLGIGLTLVKQLVEMHGGSVEASSGGPGLGSVFRVRLPVHRETPVAASTPERSPAPRARRRRILVVDDNKDSAESLAMLLSLTGHETQTAFDGIAAIDAAERLRPEIMLLDIGLPRLDGFEVCRRIRQQPWGQGIVIVALTGWGHEEDRRASSDAGFNDHLVKPVDYDALTRLMATLQSERPSAQ
jgi:PAS domain S-box-containing protein